MKKYLLLIIYVFSITAKAQTLYFPPTSGTDWDTISPASLGWCEDKIDTLYDYLEARNSKAFILLKDGKIVMEKYFGTFTMDSVWYWASAGKTLTAFTVGIAQQEGFLDINDPTSQYLGAGWTVCPPAKEDLITIKHQLSMTSGLDDGVPDNHCFADTCLQYIADAGTRWAYHNAPYTLLDSVIYYATGQSLNSYVMQNIGVPIGMTGMFVYSNNNNVFYSKPRSMARFGLLILNHGNWNGNQILTDTEYFNQMVNTSQNINQSYGYLWWLNGKSSYRLPNLQLQFNGYLNPNAPADMYAALGKNGQFINVVPSMNLTFIRMGNAPTSSAVPFTMNDTIWQKLIEIMCNKTAVTQVSVERNAVLQVYPNPAQHTFTIELPNKSFSLEVFDITGRKIYAQDNISNRTEIDCSNFSRGIYKVQVTDSKNSYNQKLIIQ
ncbi:MAG: serine hydrolase [Bacteroidia bacterium]|nr:serine hydrolase [Bacteroidia bacterium]